MTATLVAFVLACASPQAAAQAEKLPRVGLLANTVPLKDLVTRTSSVPLYEGHPTQGAFDFERELARLGWVDGKTVRIVWRSAEGRDELLPKLAQELVDAPVDVIVAFGPGVAYAYEKTRTIPIVMGAYGTPVEAGFARSLAKPGGNVTGVTVEAGSALYGKRLSLLKAAAPKTTRVAFMSFAPKPPPREALAFDSQGEAAAAKSGVSVTHWTFAGVGDLENAFALALKDGADALLFTDAPILYWRETQAEIERLAVRHKLPIMHSIRVAPELGGLMTYAADVGVNYRRAAHFVDRILRGAKPGDLPIEQPARFEFVINLNAARAIGLAIPQEALLQAGRIIR